MPEDNYLECINAIAETMKGTRWVGEWYGKSLLSVFANKREILSLTAFGTL